MLKSSRFFGIIPQHTRFFSVSSRRKAHLKDVFIVEAARTPMGSFRSQLATVTAPQLAAVAIRAILQRSGVAASEVQEVFLGQVCQANVGQAPARQAALQAGLDVSTVVTTVNKVVIGGGMESMSQVPYYMPRGDTPYGGIQLIDGITKDGLTDAFDNLIMGLCGEKTASDLGISREDQDAYAIQSYTRSAQAWQTGLIGPEIVPVNVKTRKGVSIVDKDEEFTRVDFDKLKALKTVFKKDGTITAGNASTLNDGAAAVLLLSEEALKKSNAKPLARIVAYGDAATNPLDFSIAPTLLVPKLLARTGLKIDDFAQIEVNEAFSVVALAFEKKLEVDPRKLNPHGGAVSLGHPIGRIQRGSSILEQFRTIEKGIFLVSGVRTPIGAFRGCLSSQTAVQLGTAAAVATIQRAGIIGSSIDETIAGCVLTANAGQNVARQIAMKAGVPDTIPAFTVNKVCSSSLKAVELAFNSIRADPTKSRILVVGTESMSNAPFYLPRGDVPYGGTPLIDGIVKDGLEDAQLKQSMGLCAEKSVKRDGITRKESDEYAIESYKRVAEAWNRGIFYDEVIPVKVKQQRGLEVSVAEDEGYEKLQEDKVPTLLPVFLKDGTGTITAANASSLNDGAAAGIVCSGAAIDKEKLPLCELIDFAETAGPPEYFTEAPFYAVKQLLLKQNLEVEDIALWEINEAFSCTALIFMKELRLDRSIVNVKGGAVALGHPLGMSGLRILISLAYSLKPGELGIAAICNGGGEAVAVLIKGMNSPCPHDDD